MRRILSVRDEVARHELDQPLRRSHDRDRVQRDVETTAHHSLSSKHPCRKQQHGNLADGSVIAAQGSSGSFEKPASAGRNLVLRLQDVQVENLLIDVRGGVGAPGYDGLDGGSAQTSGCLWGSGRSAGNGQDGAAGQQGAAGGVVRLEVPEQFDVEKGKVRLEGGAGGAGGKPGKAGPRSEEKGCWFYSVAGEKPGAQGQGGAEGAKGSEGRLEVKRF